MREKFIPLADIKAEVFSKNPNIEKKYNSLDLKYKVIEMLIKLRNSVGLNQKDVAKRMKTTQSVIARIENAKTFPSMRTIEKYAAALGMKPEIKFVPIKN